MAHIRKVGSGYQLQYYLNHRKRYKQFSHATPFAVVEAERKRIEAALALHRAGIKKFGDDHQVVEFISLAELTEQVLKSKEHEVSVETIARNWIIRYTGARRSEVARKKIGDDGTFSDKIHWGMSAM